MYLSPPLGSLVLTLVQGRLGHRVCMALTDLVQFLSVFIVVLFPITVGSLYLCSILMGLSTGLATGLCISYSGEVCEPKLRGALTSALNVFYFAGYFFVTTAYAITDSWKMTMLITVAAPIFNLLAVFAVSNSRGEGILSPLKTVILTVLYPNISRFKFKAKYLNLF